LLALAVVIVLTDALDRLRRRTHTYTVVFDVASGVPNIKRGSEVRVGGVRMGEVTKVDPRLGPDNKTLRDIAIEFELDQKAHLFRDAQILVSAPLIGSDGWLDIPSVGTPHQGEANQEIVGATSAGFLTALLGGANKAKADQIVDNAVEFTEFLANLQEEYERRIVPVIDDVKSTTGDARAVMGDFREQRWPAWAQSVDQVMTWAAGMPAKIDEAVAEGTDLLTDARGVIAENRENVHDTIENVEAVSQRVRDETVDKVHALLERGQQGVDSAAAVLRNLQTDYQAWATDVGESLANATIASQQLKLATIEVRRSPWKLLYRPTTDELQHELLYEAARSFAVAASDVKAAAESVQRVIDSNRAQTLQNSESFDRLQKSLLGSLERYQQAQQRLLDIIIDDTQPPR